MDIMGIGKRIQAAMLKAGKRPVDIARHLGIKDAAVHQWFTKDSGPRTTRIPELARFLSVSVDHLMQEPSPHRPYNEITKEVREADLSPTLAATEAYERTVPVIETEQPGLPGGDFTMGDYSEVRVRRPPKLDKRTDIFAFYVQGGGAPRYEVGDLVYCERHIPARGGDYVVVQLKTGACYFRKLISRTADRIHLVNNGAPKPLDIPTEKIARILRVMTIQDLLG